MHCLLSSRKDDAPFERNGSTRTIAVRGVVSHRYRRQPYLQKKGVADTAALEDPVLTSGDLCVTNMSHCSSPRSVLTRTESCGLSLSSGSLLCGLSSGSLCGLSFGSLSLSSGSILYGCDTRQQLVHHTTRPSHTPTTQLVHHTTQQLGHHTPQQDVSTTARPSRLCSLLCLRHTPQQLKTVSPFSLSHSDSLKLLSVRHLSKAAGE